MDKTHIALIGAGNLGSRHLQALSLCNMPLIIDVVDPCPESLLIAKNRFEQENKRNDIQANYHTELKSINHIIDISIIATNANIRKDIAENLIQTKEVKYVLLEKVVFQGYEDFLYIKTLLDLHQIKAWVNCPRRMFSFYQKLQEKLKNATFVDLSVKGAQWGLGCNAIHMIDLYAFITGNTNFSLDNTSLLPGWIDSKRKGFVEFTGALYGRSNIGTINLTSYAEGNMPCVIDIASDDIRCIIYETEKIASVAEKADDWKWEEYSFDMPYQSQLTNLVVESLLNKGECILPSYEESMLLHRELLASFLDHVNKTSCEELKKCPIT